jgi:hypothetical protein
MVEPAARRACVLWALGVFAMTACGGISERHVGDNEGGSGGDGGTGGPATGGRGGKGVGAIGGSSATGGGVDGGSTFTGGTGATGGSGANGGKGAFGGTAGTTAGWSSSGGTVPVGGFPSGGAPSNPYAIPWYESGYVSPEANLFGIEGQLYFATDCESASVSNLPCTQPNNSLLGPDGQYGWAVSSTVACARGIATQVSVDPVTGFPAYDLQWGVLLGIRLYQPGLEVFDAKAYGVGGFLVDIAGVAPGDLRVNVVTLETVGTAHFVTLPTQQRDAAILFDQAQQGAWIPNPVPLDTSRITGIEFHVYTNANAPQPFDFCISNLRAIPL